MFSPDASLQNSLSLRNPRRRHRTTSEDSLATRQSHKRRKRSSLALDTFDPPSASKQNGLLAHANGRVKDQVPDYPQRDVSAETANLVVRSRGSKRGDKRVRKDDGTVQARTEHYTVTKDYNIPSALSELLSKEPWHGTFSPNLGYAVAITHSQVIVWAYAPKGPNIDSSKARIIKLPYSSSSSSSSRNSCSPLPLATLVHDAGVGELALMVVMPNGKLVYWESVSSASSSDTIRQKQQGLQGSVGGMFSGEIITDLTEAEPDGFILTSSVGRVIHATVRDPQGRPNVSIRYLRSGSGAGGGLLDSFKSVFNSSAWKKEIAAVRPGPLKGKNNRQCVIANVQGHLQVWDLTRHGNQNLEFEYDGRDDIVKNIQNVDTSIGTGVTDMRLLDITLYPTSWGKIGDGHRLLALAVIPSGTKSHYFVLDLTIRRDSLDVNVVYPVTCWYGASRADNDWAPFKPRILLPGPAHTAFLAFDTFLILLSLGKIEESPDLQLQAESHSLSEPYQDILFLNRDNLDHLVGCAVDATEQNSDEASCLLLASNFGLSRATAYPSVENVSVDQRRAAMCRSRIELAVFFGHSQTNLFDFRHGISATDWQNSEIVKATQDINDSIINNTCPYIPAMVPSMDHQLRIRSTALADLIKCVSKYSLPISLRWHMLWTAEKVNAAKCVWLVYNETLTNKEPNEKILLPELIDMIHESLKHENRPELGETDVVRHFLVHDVIRMDLIVVWAQLSLENLYDEKEYSLAQKARLTQQASNILSASLEKTFEFRQSHAELYGVGIDDMEEGIYQGDYSAIPDTFWTSTENVVARVKAMADLMHAVALHTINAPEDEDIEITRDLEYELTLDNTRLVSICCKIYDERIRFLRSRQDEESRAQGDELLQVFPSIRKELICGLQDFGLIDDAFKIAERYGDMASLAEVLGRFETECAEELLGSDLSEEEITQVKRRAVENVNRLSQYFRTYGSRWSKAWYERKLEGGEFNGLLFEDSQHHDFLTQYLRDQGDVNNFAWVLEVSQGNYKVATEQLLHTRRSDGDLWSGKIETSMAKLSMLAAAEADQAKGTELMKVTRKTDKKLRIVRIQEQLYDFLRPLTLAAVDKDAALSIIVEAVGGVVDDQQVLNSVLKSHLHNIIHAKALGPEDLMDTLTLMCNTDQVTDESGFASRRFYLALKLLDYSSSNGERRNLDLKILWRRCMLQDDWTAFNRTESKDDGVVLEQIENTVLFQTLKLGFKESILEVLPPHSPSEVFGAGCNVESLRTSSRFATSSSSLLKKLAHDHTLEDKALAVAVDQGRLEEWWPGIVKEARENVRSEADEEGQLKAAQEAQSRQIEAALNGAGVVDNDGDVPMS